VNGGATSLLFVYGTLRDPEVQQAVFGRTVPTETDALCGYGLTRVVIDGQAYRGLQASGDSDSRVAGLVLGLSEADLAAADAYEGETDYVRVRIRLESGREAFVYLGAAGRAECD
jgi:gamma-glutamylcyclotransferase (GGCT)/AIG2-like uncharacterized protein YtfP